MLEDIEDSVEETKDNYVEKSVYNDLESKYTELENKYQDLQTKYKDRFFSPEKVEIQKNNINNSGLKEVEYIDIKEI